MILVNLGGFIMPRHIEQHKFAPMYAEPLFYEIKAYLEYEGFEYVNYKGEYVFQKGEGWVTAPTFVKISINGDTLQLETWLKYAILPSVFVGEIGLKGFIGAAVKGTMKRVIANVPGIVAKYSGMQPQFSAAPPVTPVVPVQPQMQYPTTPQPQYPHVQNPQYPQNPQNR